MVRVAAAGIKFPYATRCAALRWQLSAQCNFVRLQEARKVLACQIGMLDLAQSLGHPGDSSAPAVKAAVADATKRIHAAGKPVREDFMRFVWINDVLVAGAQHLLGTTP